ncbi:MAG TPA: hypothetical protein VKE70_15630 [Candidatus Solibacter sp.]|nr:hypothetical protein [Candidatus Solibacter sp.]
MKQLLVVSAMSLAAVLTGCAGSGGYVVRYGPPPAPRYGVLGYAPGPGYVWTDGYWDRRSSQWVWMSGRWMRPPHARAVWVPGNWYQERNGWRFRRGYWR